MIADRVHYVPKGNARVCRAALVTEEITPDIASLVVFSVADTGFRQRVPRSLDRLAGTWHELAACTGTAAGP